MCQLPKKKKEFAAAPAHVILAALPGPGFDLERAGIHASFFRRVDVRPWAAVPCGKALQAMAALPCFKFAFRAEGRSELSCAKNPDTPEPLAPPQRPIPPPPNLLSRLRGLMDKKKK